MSLHSPGKAFRAALSKENPLQIVGTINANHALLAQRAGYQAIYLSGGGVAAGSLGLPDGPRGDAFGSQKACRSFGDGAAHASVFRIKL